MWSTGYSPGRSCGPASTAPGVTSGSGNNGFRVVGLVDTLLGPEGTGASPGDLGLRDRWPHFSVMGRVASVGPVVF